MAEVTLLPVAAGGPQLRAPEPLTPEHDIAQFRCDAYPDLAVWLQKRALGNEGRASRTIVLPLGSRVVGYYCLATGAVMHAVTTAKLRRNMPEPVPVLVIGRLAIDDAFKGQRYGAAMLQDAVIRCLQASKTVGVRAIMVHAKDEKTAAFYTKYKFIPSPSNPLTLFLPIETAEQVFQ